MGCQEIELVDGRAAGWPYNCSRTILFWISAMNDEDKSRSSNNPTEGTRRGKAVIVKRKNFHVTTFAECPFFNMHLPIADLFLLDGSQLQCWAAFNFAAKIIHHGIHRKHFEKESYLLGVCFFSSWPVSVYSGLEKCLGLRKMIGHW